MPPYFKDLKLGSSTRRRGQAGNAELNWRVCSELNSHPFLLWKEIEIWGRKLSNFVVDRKGWIHVVVTAAYSPGAEALLIREALECHQKPSHWFRPCAEPEGTDKLAMVELTDSMVWSGAWSDVPGSLDPLSPSPLSMSPPCGNLGWFYLEVSCFL